MRILFLVSRELKYPRNDVLLRAFRRLGTVDVIGPKERGSIVLQTILVLLKAFPRLLFRKYDLVFVGFYGHLLMLVVGKVSRSPTLIDAFVSTYDTLCFDRETFKPGSLGCRLAFWLDQTSCRLADLVLLDTQPHARFFSETFDLSSGNISVLPVGCNEDIFYPRPVDQGEETVVLHYSTYLPLHGVETIVHAAARLQSEPGLIFRLLGNGDQFDKVYQLASNLGLRNITFLPFLPLENLPTEIAAAQICLGGHFGTSSKASRVVPGKIYQILAMARPLIAADSTANRELLTHAQNALLCPPADPDSLASAILDLHHNKPRRDKLAAAGRALYLERCSESVIHEHLDRVVSELISRH